MAAAQQKSDDLYYDPDFSFVQNVERLCGPDAAASLINNFGGLRLFIPYAVRLPSATKTGSQLLQAVSIEHAKILSYVTGGESFDIPMPNPDYEVLRLTLQGVPVQDIARRIRHTERSVYMIRRRLRENGDLPPSTRGGAND